MTSFYKIDDYKVKCHSGAERWQSELSAAFDLVAPKANWKMPIDAEVPAATDVTLISDAVIHFTGSKPELRSRGKTLFVKAAGYYATIGA